MIAAPSSRQAAPLFAALGDVTRLRLINRLSARGTSSITHLAEHSRVSRQAITKHLVVLERAGFVGSARRGRERVWHLQPARIADVHAYLAQVSRQWDVALDRLQKFVET